MNARMSLIASSVMAAFCLTSCQSWQPGGQALRVMPAEQVRHSTSRPAALYAIGRYHQGQMRYDRAIEAYSRLLAEYPDHAEGHNALGMIFAKQGRHDEAVDQLEQAVANADGSASMRNNLGYAYLLQGRVDAAIVVLEAAARLDPGNPRVRENMELALARAGLGEAEPVQTVLAAKEVPAPASPAPVPSERIQLVSIAENVLVLRLPPPQPTPAKAVPVAAAPASLPENPVQLPEKSAKTAVAGKGVKVEVANGNGVTGLAKKTSGYLQDAGYTRTRLTNDPPYRLLATALQYRPGFEQQALDLQASLRGGIPMTASTQLRADVHIRLVLGKDARNVNEVLAQVPVANSPLQLAAVTP